MMLPKAPAKISVRLIMSDLRCPSRMHLAMSQAMNAEAAIRKRVRMYLPVMPPMAVPKANPSFSTKCRWHQVPMRGMSSPRCMWVLTSILTIWSTTNMMAERMISCRVNFFLSIGVSVFYLFNEFVVPLLPEATDEWLFKVNIQGFSVTAGATADVPPVVVDGGELAVVFYADGVEVAADRLGEGER